MTNEIAMSLWVITADFCEINGVAQNSPSLPLQAAAVTAPPFPPGWLKGFQFPTRGAVHKGERKGVKRGAVGA